MEERNGGKGEKEGKVRNYTPVALLAISRQLAGHFEGLQLLVFDESSGEKMHRVVNLFLPKLVT